MSKRLVIQLALLLSGFLIVGVLFQQPKFIVDQSKLEAAEEQNAETQSTESHKPQLDKDISIVIAELMTQFSNVDNYEKKCIFADSIAETYRKSFVFDSSAKYFEVAAALNPTPKQLEKAALGSFEAFQNSSNPAMRKELGRKADGFLEKILALDPERIDLKIKHAVVKVNIEPMPMAGITMLKEIIDQYPSNIEARLQLGEYQMKVNFLDKAIHQFSSVLSIDSTDLKANVYITQCYIGLSKTEKAKKQVKKLKEQNFTDPYIISVIEKLEAELKNL